MNRTELPQTLRRSSKEVQAAFATAHEMAVRRYGEGEEAQRAAYGELKQSYDLVTDHWYPSRTDSVGAALVAIAVSKGTSATRVDNVDRKCRLFPRRARTIPRMSTPDDWNANIIAEFRAHQAEWVAHSRAPRWCWFTTGAVRLARSREPNDVSTR